MKDLFQRPSLLAKIAIGAFLALFVAGVINGAMAADKGGPKAAPTQNIFDEPPPVAKAPNWTGCYVGVVGSYDMQNTSQTGIFTTQSIDTKDLSYGGTAGCDMQVKGSNIVVGLNGSWMKSNASNEAAELDSSWNILGRVGVLFSPTTLGYVTAGHTSVDGTFVAPSMDKGVTVGIGIETYVFQNVTVKAEFLHIDLGEGTVVQPGPDPLAQSYVNTFRLGANYRF